MDGLVIWLAGLGFVLCVAVILGLGCAAFFIHATDRDRLPPEAQRRGAHDAREAEPTLPR